MRDYIVVLLGICISTIALGLIAPILPLFVNAISNSYFYVGLIVSIPYLAIIVMGIFWGYLSDKIGERKKIIFFGLFIGSIFFFFYPLSQNVFFTVGIRTAQCCFLAVIVLTYAVLAEHMPKEIGKSMGDANFSIGIGWLIGGGLSGFIYATNALLFFYFCGFISIISSIAFLFITEEKKGRIFILTSPFSLNRILEIRILCLLAFFLLTANYIIYGIFPVYMKHLGLKTEFIGILYGLSGLTGIPAVWYAGRLCDRIGRRPILFFSIFIYLFIWLCFAITENTIIISILWLIPAWSLFAPSTIAMVTDMTDEKERGRGLGLLNGSIYIGGFVGALLGGYIVDKFNFNFAFIIASFLVVLALVVGMKTKETYKTNC